MATLTFTLDSAATGTMTKVYTVTEVQMSTFIAALISVPAAVGDVVTPAQVWQHWTDRVFDEECVQVTWNYQQQQALIGLVPIISST